MQLRCGRTVFKADEGMVGDPNHRRRLFHFVVRVQTLLVVNDELQGVPGRRQREKQVLGGDQNTASTCPLECVRGPDLREYVVTAVRRGRATVLLSPIRA